MVVIRDKKDCCGCNACGDICLKHAITFEEDEEGFWYPKIDKTICVNCGLCQKVCPMLNESFGKKIILRNLIVMRQSIKVLK